MRLCIPLYPAPFLRVCELNGLTGGLQGAGGQDKMFKELTLHPRVTTAAKQLVSKSLRLWHDHLLVKESSGKSTPTEFHQDQPYWSHDKTAERDPISCWIALQDTPVERGCMSFLPGSQEWRTLESQNLNDARDLFGKAPDLEFAPRVTLPLKAGDCTFHHGRCARMAGPNDTDVARAAHVIIYMEADTKFSGKGHVCTDPLDLEPGTPLDQDIFPLV